MIVKFDDAIDILYIPYKILLSKKPNILGRSLGNLIVSIASIPETILTIYSNSLTHHLDGYLIFDTN
jgi:hypothetical protein